MDVNQILTAGFGSSLLTIKPMGKNWLDVQDKCNRWETLRKEHSTGKTRVKIPDQLIAVESLSVNFFAHKYEIAF